jgi:cytochrome c oxidase subunit 3
MDKMGVTVTTNSATTRVGTKPRTGGVGSNGFRGNGKPRGPGGGQPGPRDRDSSGFEPQKYRIGILVAIASIVMLFAALSSAYIIRQTRGLSDAGDWQAIALPRLLWFNTVLLAASSVSLEAARRMLRRGKFAGFNRWMLTATLLGVGFLIGQIVVWRQLAAQGIYLSSNPHSSFFYLLTGAHGIHLLGGIVAMTYVTIGGLRYYYNQQNRAAVEATALYWHFMDGLWIYLFFLLFFWG